MMSSETNWGSVLPLFSLITPLPKFPSIEGRASTRRRAPDFRKGDYNPYHVGAEHAPPQHL